MVEGEGDGGVDDDDGDHSEKAKQEEIRRDMELMALFDGADAPITPIKVSSLRSKLVRRHHHFHQPLVK